MAPEDTNEPKSAARELLLEDYRNFSESLWKNEQTGETRVNWFIGIVTAAAGGLIGLTGSEHRPHGEPLRLVFLASLFALLAFGVITLLRIMKRNEATDGYKQESDAIRQMFRDHFDDDHILGQYHPFGGGREKNDVARKLGGLAHTVLTINSLLFAGLVAALLFPIPVPSAFDGLLQSSWVLAACMAASAAFGLAFAAQFIWVQRIDLEAKNQLRPRKPTHAGGIVYRLNPGIPETPEYLLVGPQHEIPGKREWLLPKGHIENGEEHWETAVREVREETGAVGRLISRVGSDEFRVGKENVIAKYYLMEFWMEVDRHESRRMDWFAFDKALESLTHKGNKNLLREAERKRQTMSREDTLLSKKPDASVSS